MIRSSPIPSEKAVASGRRERRAQIATALSARIPYDLVQKAALIYRRLQTYAWPDVVERHMAVIGAAYCRATDVDPASDEFAMWVRAYNRHTWHYMPSHLAAIAITGLPTHLRKRIVMTGWRRLEDARDEGGIVALSRTGMSIAVPWLLADHGFDVSIIAQSHELMGLTNALIRFPAIGSRIAVIPADSRSLLHARNALRLKRIVVIYPEFGHADAKTTIVPFIRTRLAVPLGCATLALLTSRRVVPVCAYEAGSGVSVDVALPIAPVSFETAEQLTAEILTVLAGWALQHADQWVGWELMAALESTRLGGK